MTISSTFIAGCTRAATSTLDSTRGRGASNSSLAGESGRERTLHLYIAESPRTLNPLIGTTTIEQELSYLAYDTLVSPDPKNILQPKLVTVVPTLANGGISRDGRTVTFRLRKGIRWQDGFPLTSADVAFTLEKVNDPKVNVAQRSGYDRIVRIATPDRATIVITLREPFAPFVSYVGNQYPIVPKHLLEHSKNLNTDGIGARPVGSGPYRLARWDRGNRLEYVANRSYFGGAPKIERLSIAEIPDQNTAALELRAHAIDMGYVESSAYSQLRAVPDLRNVTEPTNDFVGYALNTHSPILQDVRVRRAISMAIDRANLTAKLTFGVGTPAYADLPAIMWTRREPANPYAYNPHAARMLLDAAGWKLGPAGIRAKDGRPLSLRNIDYSGSKTSEITDTAVAQMLREIGIAWSTKYYGVSLYFESKQNGGPLLSGDFDTGYVPWLAGIDTENDMLYTCANRIPFGSNYAQYCSGAMDALQHDALTTLDPARRRSAVADIEKLAVTDVPYVFLYHNPWRIVWSPKLRRAHSTINDPWYDIAGWSFTNP